MIIADKLEKPYGQITIRSFVWFKCDYCGAEFQRVKKSRERLNKIIDKDSCGSKECKNKKNCEVNFKKFGVQHLFQSEQFKTKNRNICLEKYGTEQYYSSEDFKKKRIESLQKNLGVDAPLKNSEIQKKHKQTMLDRYGVENAMQSDEIKQKALETNLSKFDSQYPMRCESVKKKRSQTNVAKYGVENYTQTDKYWQKRKQSTLKNRGCEHTSQDPQVRKKYQDTIAKKYDGATNLSQVPGVLEKIEKTMMEKYGVPSALCLQQNRQYGKTENEIKDWLNSFGFNFISDYTVLNGKELDAYDPKSNIAIEYCGLFWHNELSKTPRLRRYHYDKYKKCLDKNVRLITIFEDEWKNKETQCKNFLKATLGICDKKIYARNCTIALISTDTHKEFCEQNHILGYNNLSIVSFGLFFQDKLVGSMSLGKHHRGKNDLVLDRLCFADGISVVGGSSKLFSACKEWAKNNNYPKIISWSDNRWSLGNVYKSMNFILEKEYGPDYSYVNILQPYKRISKQSQKKKEKSSKTEREICLEKGLARIWDCGKKRWAYEINS